MKDGLYKEYSDRRKLKDNLVLTVFLRQSPEVYLIPHSYEHVIEKIKWVARSQDKLYDVIFLVIE